MLIQWGLNKIINILQQTLSNIFWKLVYFSISKFTEHIEAEKFVFKVPINNIPISNIGSDNGLAPGRRQAII